MTADTTTPSTIDEALLEGLLRRAEGNAHRRGWDHPSQRLLFVVYDRTDRDTDLAYRMACPGVESLVTTVGRYVARPLTPPQALGNRPMHAVYHLACNLTIADHPITRELLSVCRQPGYLGVGFLTEGWQQAPKPGPETEEFLAERARNPKRSFMDMPGSEEVRFVLFVGGPASTEVLVHRVRSQGNPGYYPGSDEVAEAGENGGYREGSGNKSLRLIHAVIAGLPQPPLPGRPFGYDPSAYLP